ncbi:MAG TPA: hypothetical protein VM940_09425 [Chthoniobacterales bacterium]|jgi:hypothetical protein|nr:hypothetical protein [Chthoniobacterales bacterium]
MLNPAVVEPSKSEDIPSDFWLRLLTDKALRDCDDLAKLLIGCEIIAAFDEQDLLAA